MSKFTLTKEQLQETYDVIAKREWPRFEDAMMHPIYSRIIKIRAELKCKEKADHMFDDIEIPLPPSNPHYWIDKRKNHASTLDNKQRASGEKEDPNE